MAFFRFSHLFSNSSTPTNDSASVGARGGDTTSGASIEANDVSNTTLHGTNPTSGGSSTSAARRNSTRLLSEDVARTNKRVDLRALCKELQEPDRFEVKQWRENYKSPEALYDYYEKNGYSKKLLTEMTQLAGHKDATNEGDYRRLSTVSSYGYSYSLCEEYDYDASGAYKVDCPTNTGPIEWVLSVRAPTPDSASQLREVYGVTEKGVFMKTDVKRLTLLGHYTGVRLIAWPSASVDQPTDNMIETVMRERLNDPTWEIPDTAATLRGSDGQWVTRDCKRNSLTTCNEPDFNGLHFMKTASTASEANCFMEEDGGVVSLKNLKKDDELFMAVGMLDVIEKLQEKCRRKAETKKNKATGSAEKKRANVNSTNKTSKSAASRDSKTGKDGRRGVVGIVPNNMFGPEQQGGRKRTAQDVDVKSETNSKKVKTAPTQPTDSGVDHNNAPDAKKTTLVDSTPPMDASSKTVTPIGETKNFHESGTACNATMAESMKTDGESKAASPSEDNKHGVSATSPATTTTPKKTDKN